MTTKVYYQNSMMLTWRQPYDALKFRYPDAKNLLVIIEYAFTPVLPSESHRKERWQEAFKRIEEVDVHMPNLTEHVQQVLRSSNEPWILCCTEDYEANRKLLESLSLSFVSTASRELDID
jgi:hypothetical protein